MDTTAKKKLWVGIIAIIGFITTIKLAFIYYNANFNPYALSSFCSINEFIDCDGVAQTTESQFFGVPLALWGLILYAFIGLMLCAEKMKNWKLFKFMEVFKNPMDYIASLGLIAFTISMILLCVSLFDIKKLCILCALTYILDLAIGIVAVDFKNGGFVHSIKQSWTDFVDALKIKPYLIAFSCVVLAAAGILIYTSTSMVLTPQVKSAAVFKEFVNAKHNKYKITGNVLGNPEPLLVIHSYTDYQCPMCKPYNIMIHKLAKEMKFVQIVHHNMPLDMSCNKYLTQPLHDHSCMLARYSIAAKMQGNEWGLASAMFEKQPQTEEDVLKIADDLDFNVDQLKEDANSPKTEKRLERDIDIAWKMGINGTPSTRIGKDIVIGIKPYGDFKAWVVKKQDELGE
ncbi:MAG: thioredoxin domain-containing protein [Clostridiaceae bacterium]|jgi:uncharacterized membrane protein/predicted DsbA family dithiol-disulfide isomerase|nr:thioredoxin domain-containing protein [Clostridiaceae bacterium]